jgi:hypothetical protein
MQRTRQATVLDRQRRRRTRRVDAQLSQLHSRFEQVVVALRLRLRLRATTKKAALPQGKQAEGTAPATPSLDDSADIWN